MDQISVQAVEHLFQMAAASEEAISVTVSFFEIYMSKVSTSDVWEVLQS